MCIRDSHKRVHDPDNHYAAKGKKVFTSVPVYCDDADYCLYGIVDCLEAAKTVSGVPIRGLDGQYQLCIVEYKPTQPKNKTYNEDDLMPVSYTHLDVYKRQKEVCLWDTVLRLWWKGIMLAIPDQSLKWKELALSLIHI